MCASTLCKLPTPEPGKTHSSLTSPYCCCLVPSLLGLFSGFPPIPGLETRKGIQEDSMAATLATAQKLASEDADLVDEDEEVWLWVQDFRV